MYEFHSNTSTYHLLQNYTIANNGTVHSIKVADMDVDGVPDLIMIKDQGQLIFDILFHQGEVGEICASHDTHFNLG